MLEILACCQIILLTNNKPGPYNLIFFPQQHFRRTVVPQCLADCGNIRRPQLWKHNPVKITVRLVSRIESGGFEPVKHVNRVSGDSESSHLDAVEFGASR